jgi:hypothetical protein
MTPPPARLVDPVADAKGRGGSGLSRQFTGECVDLTAPLEAERGDIRLKVPLVGACPAGRGAGEIEVYVVGVILGC